MRPSIHGGQIPYSPYEAAAAVLVALCWGEEDDLQQLLTRIFSAEKAVEIMSDKDPKEAALFELYGQLKLGVDLVSELATIVVQSPRSFSAEDEYLTQLTGLIARGDADDAISLCCKKFGCLDPACDYYVQA